MVLLIVLGAVLLLAPVLGRFLRAVLDAMAVLIGAVLVLVLLAVVLAVLSSHGLGL